jgi:hypothetical protein
LPMPRDVWLPVHLIMMTLILSCPEFIKVMANSF